MRDEELWARIQSHPMDVPGADRPYSVKLAAEQGWTEEHTKEVIEEYKRFVYLTTLGRDEVTPSPDVDRAWHLHLTYTRDYWDVFCAKVLGRPLHHDPCVNEADMPRYGDQYEATKALYTQEFGFAPPREVWPARDADSLQAMGGWVFNLGCVASVITGFFLIPSGAQIWWIAFSLALGVTLLGWALDRRHRPAGRRTSCGDGSGAGCGDGGCGGGGD